MKLFLFTLLLSAAAAANQDAPSGDVTAPASGDVTASDQSPDSSQSVTYVQSHVTAHDDGYGHGPDEVHRHTVATTFHYPDYEPYPAHHGVYVAPPVYGHAVGYAPGYGGYAPGYAGYAPGHDHGHIAYAPVGYGHGPVAYGHGGRPY